MITAAQYFGTKPHTPEQAAAFDDLNTRVTALLTEVSRAGAYNYDIDFDTGSLISGSRNGAGDGGFRLPNAATGRAGSSHKDARGIDIYDPYEKLDTWLSDGMLANHGLYREHPSKTVGWCHLTTREPGSKRRTFYP